MTRRRYTRDGCKRDRKCKNKYIFTLYRTCKRVDYCVRAYRDDACAPVFVVVAVVGQCGCGRPRRTGRIGEKSVRISCRRRHLVPAYTDCTAPYPAAASPSERLRSGPDSVSVWCPRCPRKRDSPTTLPQLSARFRIPVRPRDPLESITLLLFIIRFTSGAYLRGE